MGRNEKERKRRTNNLVELRSHSSQPVTTVSTEDKRDYRTDTALADVVGVLTKPGRNSDLAHTSINTIYTYIHFVEELRLRGQI